MAAIPNTQPFPRAESGVAGRAKGSEVAIELKKMYTIHISQVATIRCDFFEPVGDKDRIYFWSGNHCTGLVYIESIRAITMEVKVKGQWRVRYIYEKNE